MNAQHAASAEKESISIRTPFVLPSYSLPTPYLALMTASLRNISFDGTPRPRTPASSIYRLLELLSKRASNHAILSR